MLEDIGSTQSVLGSLHQQLRDQVLGIVGDRIPVTPWEAKFPLLDIVKQVELTPLTVAPLSPTTL